MNRLIIAIDNIDNSETIGKIVNSAIQNIFEIKTELIDIKLPIRKNIKPYYFDDIHNYILQFKEKAFLVTDKAIITYDFMDINYSAGSVNLDETVGFMSTYPLEHKNDLGLITQIAIHEIGHILGLKHHETKIQNENKYCFMRPKNYDESFEQYANIISPNLCKNCKKKLGIQKPLLTRLFRK